MHRLTSVSLVTWGVAALMGFVLVVEPRGGCPKESKPQPVVRPTTAYTPGSRGRAGTNQGFRDVQALDPYWMVRNGARPRLASDRGDGSHRICTIDHRHPYVRKKWTEQITREAGEGSPWGPRVTPSASSSHSLSDSPGSELPDGVGTQGDAGRTPGDNGGKPPGGTYSPGADPSGMDMDEVRRLLKDKEGEGLDELLDELLDEAGASDRRPDPRKIVTGSGYCKAMIAWLLRRIALKEGERKEALGKLSECHDKGADAIKSGNFDRAQLLKERGAHYAGIAAGCSKDIEEARRVIQKYKAILGKVATGLGE